MKRIWILGAVMIVAVGCSEDPAAEPPADDVVLRVVVDGEVAADWTLVGLREQVAFADVAIDGDMQSGPRLLDVLAASGVDQWDAGQVIGLGEGRVFEVGLGITSAEVDDGWILDVTKQETLKLAAPELPREQWVRDVGEISIP
jgi:hypothetical protein